MNKFGFPLESIANNHDKVTSFLSKYLQQGCLGVILGAGASYDLGLPDWKSLVKNCMAEILPSRKMEFEDSANLKKYASDIKEAFAGDQQGYRNLVRKHLYAGTDFNFQTANKNLLIALMSLFVGKTRGTVRRVISYNFDSVVEWYLRMNGLSISFSDPKSLFSKRSDVELTHLHGYLPHDRKFGEDSETIIFTKEDFEDRNIQLTYWKVIMQEFYRHNIFLTIGLSPESLLDDIVPHLRDLSQWYQTNKVSRNQPYGFAFLTPSIDVSESDKEDRKLIAAGIIPLRLEIPTIPEAVFTIAQKAVG